MPFQAQPRRKTICKSLINPVDMLLTECGNIGAVESVDKAGVFPRVANWLSISVFQAAAEFFGIFNAADTTITDTTIYLYNNKHIGESENQKIRKSEIVLSTCFLFSFQEKRHHQLTRVHKPERLVLGCSCVLVACITSSSTALLGLGSPSKQAL